MPTNLVRSKQDEDDWAEARRIVNKQYPDKSPDDKDKSYWKLTTSIYENIKKNRGKKQMQKQASVGELLAGQLKLRKQADDNRRRGGWRPRGGGGVVTADKITGGDGVVTADKINAGGHVDTLEYRPPWHGWYGRTIDWLRGRGPKPPMPERTPAPIPKRLPAPGIPTQVPLPAPAPRPFPIPRGIRGPWDRPEEQPNNPMDNERIRRLVEGNNAPAPGGGSVGRPVDDSEIPLPSEDPGGWTPPKNTPSKNTPKIPSINPEELWRSFQEFHKNWRHHIMPMKMPDGSWSRSRWEWIGPGERPKEGPEVFEKYYEQYPSLRGGW